MLRLEDRLVRREVDPQHAREVVRDLADDQEHGGPVGPDLHVVGADVADVRNSSGAASSIAIRSSSGVPACAAGTARAATTTTADSRAMTPIPDIVAPLG